MADPAAEARGKFLYDIASSHVGTQAADQQALTSRAKDLIGYTAIASTITGAIANDKIFAVDSSSLPEIFAVLLAIGVALVLTAGLYVLKPREWSFTPETAAMFEHVGQHLSDDVDSYYAAAARGLANRGVVSEAESAIERNTSQLKKLEKGVYVQLLGVAMLALSGLTLAALAFVVDDDATAPIEQSVHDVTTGGD